MRAEALFHTGTALLKIILVILVGMPASLLVTAAVAKNIRKFVNTELEPAEVQPPSRPFTLKHHIAWGGAFRFLAKIPFYLRLSRSFKI